MGTPINSAAATWLNGMAWRDGDDLPAGASVLEDRGFVLGDGLFETVLIRDGQAVLWRGHLERLSRTARVLHFPLPADLAATARAAVEALLPLVGASTERRGTLRITLTRGSGTAFGLEAPAEPAPTLMLRLTPAHRRSRAFADRETAWIVDQPRIDPNGVLSGHKTTSSMWRIMAHETARREGADLALLKTTDGDLGEADTACFFAVIAGTVVTPPLSRGILPSTTRAFVVAELETAGRAWAERTLYPENLEQASEAFLTSSVTGIRALAAIDGRALPESAPTAEWLDSRYEALAGGF